MTYGDWSSDVCSSDLWELSEGGRAGPAVEEVNRADTGVCEQVGPQRGRLNAIIGEDDQNVEVVGRTRRRGSRRPGRRRWRCGNCGRRSWRWRAGTGEPYPQTLRDAAGAPT